ncbi:glutathione peroxidase [Psychrobacter ciconiae]|uniref:glutathione peroxidase n=1 Tax=Psychrobacter ciconiae TaxID=1553449 RepID=UPI0019187E53|nr:glutathione peroxidase [Psychrobacter ciconiae]
MSPLYQFSATTIDGNQKHLSDYQDQVLLIVNTASKCGFTPQFAGLEDLYQRYNDQGFMVIGFPCNQFGGQDPEGNAQIGEFCQKNYGVSFDMMAKVDVNGKNADPIFTWLKGEQGGMINDAIKWNFTKFLISRDGNVIKRYASTVKPEAIAADIEKALAQN